ncbi:hypothetical protein P5V93_23300 [Mycobacteroides abscessus subsp. abscessus]|uniref:hypothetical protein n=1 Tax=Mycobacteroides abscessus TaxID=36809 RepID=UPI0002E27C56|nr:hypothetical protein [Mycobacteroides abscessus]MDO3101048.1 hypothetical protein [Mycobacteroides abscessus subsp. abscessus]MDO3185011.1 hypothetical protein [Mycobacteroides abscessus subsp. abscessus]MDO3194366.1 hypothetical protein [Mycobacteroides abscessus subsp. abscessus]MDO3287439.1 hypothetical protein [Mycobacteroides abscessus subsp. abscessus]OLT84733.1 hypothetical protein BKG58_15840 [Mycobacteroides abscessus subsp. abscessus]
MTQAQQSERTALSEAEQRKKRQGSNKREKDGLLGVRYDRTKLKALQQTAGEDLGTLVRQYGDLLTDLLPGVKERGLNPVDLIKEAAEKILEEHSGQVLAKSA